VILMFMFGASISAPENSKADQLARALPDS
jgi:hypothetical protein